MKKSLSIILAVLLLMATLPLSVSAATLKITKQPKTTYASFGATAKVTVKASGSGLKYTWYFKNAGAKKYSKSSAKKTTYSVQMSDKADGRYVYCVVKDKKGKSIKTKTVSLRMKATITSQPKAVQVKKGETAKVTLKAKGTGLKYKWYVKNSGATKYTKSSITKSYYSVKMSDTVNGRYVYCVVTDKYGKSAKSKTVQLKQQITPLYVAKQPESAYAAVGDEVSFAVVAAGGKAPYTYRWEYVSTDVANWQEAEGEVLTEGLQNLFLFRTTSDTFDKRYLFRCLITDASGAEVSSSVAWVNLLVAE